MSVTMLHTCQIRVKDLEASLKFYKEALGLLRNEEERTFLSYKFTLFSIAISNEESKVGSEVESYLVIFMIDENFI